MNHQLLKYVWWVLVLMLGMISCEPTTQLEDFTLQNANKQISIFGSVNPQQGIQLRLAKSSAAVGEIDFKELALNNPSVNVQVNKDKIIPLIADVERFYTTTENYSFQAGENLELIVVADDLPTATSSTITIPTLPNISNLRFYDTGEFTVNSLPVWKLNFDLQLNDNTNYYVVDITAVDPDTQEEIRSFFETWFNSQNADLCDFRKGGGYNLYFSTDCTTKEQLNVDLNIQLSENFRFNGISSPLVEQVKISIFAIDENLYEFIETTSSIRTDDLFLSEPYITHSNIENGYGVFYATNQIDTIIQVR